MDARNHPLAQQVATSKMPAASSAGAAPGANV